MRGVWRELVGEEPEVTPAYTSDWAETGGREELFNAANSHFDQINKSKPVAGDLLLFRLRVKSPAKHLGIYTGKNHFIHAHDGSSVVESPMSEFWWRRIDAAFRFPGAKI